MSGLLPESVFVAGLGATTSVGRGAWASAAAMRAGIAGFAQHPYMVDSAGEPMHAAMVPWLGADMRGIERLAALLLPAIEEALQGFRGLVTAERFALALCLPGPRPGLPPNIVAQLVGRVQQRFPGSFGAVATFEAGHAAGLVGMRAGLRRLSQGSLDACLVAAVDSWVEPETLEWLEAEDQLHGAGLLNNAWGFVPGEAGASVLLLREGALAKAGAATLGRVLSVGQAHEAKRIKTQTVCIGEGLTQAFRAALQALPRDTKVSDIWCDMNGEPYRADEFGFCALRTGEHFEAVSEFLAPADCWGDVGAAGSLLHCTLACAAWTKGYARGPLSFIWSSGEAGERAAALLAFDNPPKKRS